MNYSYVLLSEKDDRFYMGSTGGLRERLRQHHSGRAHSTADRRPFRLVYYEAGLSGQDARRRETYVTSGRGGRYLKQRLAYSLSEISFNKLERH